MPLFAFQGRVFAYPKAVSSDQLIDNRADHWIESGRRFIEQNFMLTSPLLYNWLIPRTPAWLLLEIRQLTILDLPSGGLARVRPVEV